MSLPDGFLTRLAAAVGCLEGVRDSVMLRTAELAELPEVRENRGGVPRHARALVMIVEDLNALAEQLAAVQSDLENDVKIDQELDERRRRGLS